MLLSRDLKNQKVALHSPPTHQNKKKISIIKSGILIKYKRINWTPSCKAPLLLPGGKFGDFLFSVASLGPDF